MVIVRRSKYLMKFLSRVFISIAGRDQIIKFEWDPFTDLAPPYFCVYIKPWPTFLSVWVEVVAWLFFGVP